MTASTAPLTAVALGDALLPMLADLGWNTDACRSADGLTRLHLTAMSRGDGGEYAELMVTRRESRASFWVDHNVVSAEVTSVGQAVGYLRLAGVLPAAPATTCYVCGAPVPAHMPKCPGPCSPRSVVAR